MKYNTDPKTLGRDGDTLLVNGEPLTTLAMHKETPNKVIARLMYLGDDCNSMVGTYIRVLLGRESIDTLELLTYVLKTMDYEQLLELTGIERMSYVD